MTTKKKQNPLDEQKEVAFYSALVNTWINIRLERDRRLLTLSYLAIGLLVAFVTQINSLLYFVIWFLACVCFVICIFISLTIINKHSDHLEILISEEGANSEEALLSIKRNSSILFRLFIVGVCLIFYLVVTHFYAIIQASL